MSGVSGARNGGYACSIFNERPAREGGKIACDGDTDCRRGSQRYLRGGRDRAHGNVWGICRKRASIQGPIIRPTLDIGWFCLILSMIATRWRVTYNAVTRQPGIVRRVG